MTFTMSEMANSRFAIVDCGGDVLGNIAIHKIRDHWGVLIRYTAPFTIEEFGEFACQFGPPLEYGEDIKLSFETIHWENEFHYDGISADDDRKIPIWVVFYLESGPDITKHGGVFMLMDSVLALEYLPSDLVQFLRAHREQFYGYPTFKNLTPDPTELTFEIDNITAYNGIERLRIHLPTGRSAMLSNDGQRVYSQAHDFSLLFDGCDAKTTMDVFAQLRNHLMREDLVWEIPFQPGDILLVNNQFAFHGRHPVNQPMSRLLHRIQILDNPLD